MSEIVPYCDDADLRAYEPKIFDYWNEYLTQKLESNRIIDEMILPRLPGWLRLKIRNGEKTIGDVVRAADLKTCAIYHTLYLIFSWVNAERGDLYEHKAARYLKLFREKLSSLSFDISTDENPADFEEEVEDGGVQIFRA